MTISMMRWSRFVLMLIERELQNTPREPLQKLGSEVAPTTFWTVEVEVIHDESFMTMRLAGAARRLAVAASTWDVWFDLQGSVFGIPPDSWCCVSSPKDKISLRCVEQLRQGRMCLQFTIAGYDATEEAFRLASFGVANA